MQEQVLRIAGHIPHPGAVAIVALVLAAIAVFIELRAKRVIIAAILAVLILVLGFTPLVSSRILRSQGVYHIQVYLVRPDRTPIYFAELKCSNPAALNISQGGWRLDIPRQIRPADGAITFTAAVKDEFLNGSSTFTIPVDDYYPTFTMQLIADTSAKIRGVVVDTNMTAVEGASVSIDGYPDVALTDKKGKFMLPAHAGNGQMVEVRAQKDGAYGRVTAPAGKSTEIILE
jgi:hypothetical protein